MGIRDFFSKKAKEDPVIANPFQEQIDDVYFRCPNLASIDSNGNLALFISQNAVSLDEFGDGVKFTLQNGTGYIVNNDSAIRFHIIYDAETLSSFEPIKFSTEDIASGQLVSELQNELMKNPYGKDEISQDGLDLYRARMSVDEFAAKQDFFEPACELLGNKAFDVYKFIEEFKTAASVQTDANGEMDIVINLKETSYDSKLSGEDKQLIIHIGKNDLSLSDSEAGTIISCQTSEINKLFDKAKDVVGEYHLKVSGRDKIAANLIALSEERENMSEKEYYTEIMRVLKDIPTTSFSSFELEKFQESIEKLGLPSFEEHAAKRAQEGNDISNETLRSLAKEGDEAVLFSLADNLSSGDTNSAYLAASYCSSLGDDFINAVEPAEHGFSIDD